MERRSRHSLVARASAGVGPLALGLLCSSLTACGEGGTLAISAGAPVTAAVSGTVTDCGKPVAAAQVSLRVQQNTPEQARPVDARVGPVTTDRQGRYLIELGPPFAVPGPADLEVRIAASGISIEITGELEFSIGRAARDTVRLDADLAVRRGFCTTS